MGYIAAAVRMKDMMISVHLEIEMTIQFCRFSFYVFLGVFSTFAHEHEGVKRYTLNGGYRKASPPSFFCNS